MANYRTQVKLQGCLELCVNSLKSKATTDAFPAKKVKKPKRSEANFYPSFPTGETLDSLEEVRLELLTEIGIRNNERVIADKMANTLAYRWHEVVNQEPSIQDFKDRWPELFTQKEVRMELKWSKSICFRIHHSELSWIGHNWMWLRLFNMELNDRIYIFNSDKCYTFWVIDILAGLLQWSICVFWVSIQDKTVAFSLNNAISTVTCVLFLD